MNILNKNIKLLVLCLCVGLFCGSCIFEKNEYNEPDDGDYVDLTLKINTVGAYNSSPSIVTEKLKSLRVIIIDESGRIDVNDKVSLPLAEYDSKNFVYTYRKQINSGDKKIYLVGNEESVNDIHLKDTEIIPEGMPLTSLTSMLDFFESEEGQEKDKYLGSDFEKVLNSVYFSNSTLQPESGSSVYLPYSSYYEVNVEFLKKVNKTIYLVPAAVKWDFVITNYRMKDIKFEGIDIFGFNTNNYLNANLDPSEQQKTLNGKKTWWIDWLEACASGTQDLAGQDKTDDNGIYNEGWGWIEKYGLPVATEKIVTKQLKPLKGDWTVAKIPTTLKPEKIYIGPFYFPESKNLTRPEGLTDKELGKLKPDDQAYWVNFHLHEVDDPVITTLSNYHIDTVHSLFRATHVIVYVELYQSKVEIYAQIEPWRTSHFVGFVQQQKDD